MSITTLAQDTVDQWDNHDRHRRPRGEEAEPVEVLLAREVLALSIETDADGKLNAACDQLLNSVVNVSAFTVPVCDLALAIKRIFEKRPSPPTNKPAELSEEMKDDPAIMLAFEIICFANVESKWIDEIARICRRHLGEASK